MTSNPSIELRFDQYLEAEKIGIGALDPLVGFMGEDDFRSVVADMRLTTGKVFSLPVTLDVNQDVATAIRNTSNVELRYEGKKVGSIEVEDIYTCDKTATALQVFGTSEDRHPGVSRFYRMNSHFVGGKVKLSRQDQSTDPWGEMSPRQTNDFFKKLNWNSIVGFQTRNIPHKAHEYLHRIALEVSDGLFIQPLIGARKKGDFTPDAVMTSYKYLLDNHYPSNRVLISPIRIPMRYAGPREAIFHALIRRNYGCTHFIVGRDHAGVGDFYGKYQAQDLIRTVEPELGIAIRYMCGPFYCAICQGIATEKTCQHLDSEPSAINEISGTWLRQVLLEEARVDTNLVRPGVIESLRGIKIFLDENDEY